MRVLYEEEDDIHDEEPPESPEVDIYMHVGVGVCVKVYRYG